MTTMNAVAASEPPATFFFVGQTIFLISALKLRNHFLIFSKISTCFLENYYTLPSYLETEQCPFSKLILLSFVYFVNLHFAEENTPQFL